MYDEQHGMWCVVWHAVIPSVAANEIAVRTTTMPDNDLLYESMRLWAKACDWYAGYTGEPLLVIAKNRVFLCILHCCMVFARLFVAFPQA